MTRTALVIGVGPGHPDQVTVEAVGALRRCNVFLVPDKGEEAADLVAARNRLLDRHVGPHRLVPVPDPPRDRTPGSADAYGRAVEAWHAARARAFAAAIEASVPDRGTVGFLVWGDPALYDSTIRVLDRVDALAVEVVPGVSSVSLLAARHRLVLNTVGGPVTVTTGRRLADEVAAGRDNLVVMLDGALSCRALDGDWDIWWGANLGTPDEVLVAGRLGDVLGRIEAARARAKAARGWVMDTYLLRRPTDSREHSVESA
ncbi:MAG: precorrin-6A synthase (deacetylating) [Nocardioidaceae bacterium]